MITAAAVAAVIGVITLINFRLEAKETARILSELAPMLNSQRFFVGIQLKPEGRDTLYAFDPETRTAANLGVLSNELIATVNPEKTRLFYLRKPVGLSVGLAQIFGKTIYSADGVVIEPKERKIRVPFHSLPGKPLSVGYGVTGIWGGSADRIFLSLLKSPGNVGSGGYIFYGDGQTLEDMSHVVFDLRDKKPRPHFPIPARANLRDALFIGDDVWYAQAYPHRLGLSTIDAEKHMTLEVEDSISSLFSVNENQIGIVSGMRADPLYRSGIFTLDPADKTIDLKFKTGSVIRKESTDKFNRMLFFIQSELNAKLVSDDEFSNEPRTTYGLYALPYEVLESDEPGELSDLRRITTLGRSGSAGYFDVNYRTKTIVFRDSRALYEISYEGGEAEELWMPPELNLQWIQAIYCD